MEATMDFDHILNWKLKKGSHPFPGKAGGTCINEAAIVAAGFKYQPVHSVEHMPECFSRPICSLAMKLNDSAGDAERQQLLPFVTRLACADTPDVEARRTAYIASRSRGCRSFQDQLQVLAGALRIGRQADDVEPTEAAERLRKAQSRASERTPLRLFIWSKSTEPA
jgi:hypothetical protein